MILPTPLDIAPTTSAVPLSGPLNNHSNYQNSLGRYKTSHSQINLLVNGQQSMLTYLLNITFYASSPSWFQNFSTQLAESLSDLPSRYATQCLEVQTDSPGHLPDLAESMRDQSGQNPTWLAESSSILAESIRIVPWSSDYEQSFCSNQ